MSSSSSLKKTEYKMIYIASFAIDLKEKMNANEVLQQLNSRSRRSTMTEKFGPVKLTVVPSALVLDRSVWWPNSSDTRLPYSDLNEVYSFVKEAKKICFDVVSSEKAERRVVWFKMKNPLDVMKALELIQKYKMASAMYEKDNVRPVQYGNWVSTYSAVVDDNGDDGITRPDRNVQSPCSASVSERFSAYSPRNLSRTPFVNKRGSETLPRDPCSNVSQELSYKLGTLDAQAQVEMGSSFVGANTPANTIQIIFQGLDPSMLMQNVPIVKANIPVVSQQTNAVPDGLRRGYAVDSSNGTKEDLVHSTNTCSSPVDSYGTDTSPRTASHFVSLLKQTVPKYGFEKESGKISRKLPKNEKHYKSTSDLYDQQNRPYPSNNTTTNSQTVKTAVPTTEPFYLMPRRSVSNLCYLKELSHSTENPSRRCTLGSLSTEEDMQQDIFNPASNINTVLTSETKFFNTQPLRIAQLDANGSRFAYISTTNARK